VAWSVRLNVRMSTGIKWRDRVTNTEVLQICGTTGIEAFSLKGQLRWVGHVMCMPEDRIPKQVFFGQLAFDGPARRYKDTLRVNLKQCNIDPGSLTSATSDRSSWQTLCHKAVTEFEDMCCSTGAQASCPQVQCPAFQ